MRIINEDVQLVRIYDNVPLTASKIGSALQRAYSNKMYARFYNNKFFIQVNFARDGNISVASNIRNPQFIADLYKRNRQRWTLPLVKSFLYQWLSISRKLLY